MNPLLLGATGRTGQLVMKQALSRGHCASNVDWTIVRPPRLKAGGVPRGYRVRSGARPAGAWAMQRADLAAFLLDEAEREGHKKEIVGITSA
jgi:NAD(P)H-binding